MGGRVFRNNCKGHLDKTKVGKWNLGREVRLAGVVGSSGGKMQITVIEQ